MNACNVNIKKKNFEKTTVVTKPRLVFALSVQENKSFPQKQLKVLHF